MTVSPRHRLRVGLLALLVAAAIVGGCGSGDDGSTGRTDAEGATAPVAPVAKEAATQPDTGRTGRGERTEVAAPGEGREDPAADSRMAERGDGGGKQRGAANDGKPAPQVEGARCPANISREQCRAEARQAANAEPSHSLDSRGDCLEAMSRSACEEMFAAENAARESGGVSVDVERCLEERSRAQCEEQLAAQLEAEYAASKGE